MSDRDAKFPPPPSTQEQQGQPTQPYFPPPPPGPPPTHAQHPNETPIPDPSIPTYNPSEAYMSSAHNAIPSETPSGLYDPPSPPAETSNRAYWSHRLAGWGSKAAGPINALTNKFGAEGFLPDAMDKECEKAARILKSFCKDGIYSDKNAAGDPVLPKTEAGGKHGEKRAGSKENTGKGRSEPRALFKIPPKVITHAQGLLIFTTVRAGFQVTGATGSGILIARLPDGTWSPPSGVHVHSLGAGFVAGLDLYDCVVVINSREALDTFFRTRVSFGSDLSVAAGPWGAGGMIGWGLPQSGEKKRASGDYGKGGSSRPGSRPGSSHASHPSQHQEAAGTGPGSAHAPSLAVPASGHGHERAPSCFRDTIKRPVYSYVKSRGLYAGWQIDGTIVTERKDANTAFYGAPVPVERILRGEVPSHQGQNKWSTAARSLYYALRRVEGQSGGQDSPGLSPAPSPVPSPVPPAAAPTVPTSNVPVPAAATTAPFFPPPPQADSSSSYVPPPPPPGPPPGPQPGGVPGITGAVGQMNLGGQNSHQPGPGGAAATSKAAEAAREAQAGQASSSAPPPSYEDTPNDLPPAYEEGEQPRPGVGDSKTGQH